MYSHYWTLLKHTYCVFSSVIFVRNLIIELRSSYDRIGFAKHGRVVLHSWNTIHNRHTAIIQNTVGESTRVTPPTWARPAEILLNHFFFSIRKENHFVYTLNYEILLRSNDGSIDSIRREKGENLKAKTMPPNDIILYNLRSSLPSFSAWRSQLLNFSIIFHFRQSCALFSQIATLKFFGSSHGFLGRSLNLSPVDSLGPTTTFIFDKSGFLDSKLNHRILLPVTKYVTFDTQVISLFLLLRLVYSRVPTHSLCVSVLFDIVLLSFSYRNSCVECRSNRYHIETDFSSFREEAFSYNRRRLRCFDDVIWYFDGPVVIVISYNITDK